MRARAKTINFATIYGQGAFALARQLGITQDDAKRFIEQYFTRFAGVRAWLDRTVAEARERGYVETLFGRRRYIPELKDRNHNKIGRASCKERVDITVVDEPLKNKLKATMLKATYP